MFHLRKSKYDSTHRLLVPLFVLGLFFSAGVIYLNLLLGLILVIFVFRLYTDLSQFLTGENYGRYGLHVERDKKGKGSIQQILINSIIRSALIGTAIYLLCIFFIPPDRR